MLKLSDLRLRSITKDKIYGAEIKFESGLNVVQAGNTSGKSTCLQAIIYALGLERSLGPQLEVPLPYAMREKIHSLKDLPYETVIQSYVELEVQNSSGEFLVVHRDIEGGAEQKLIQTWSGPKLTAPEIEAERRDFFVHDPGAAVREDGFHTFLARFIGWELPEVSRYDGTECPLYLETIFPMLFVEQKRGWSAIQGPFPTYLRIQDVPRRVLEFLLDLEAGHIRRERAELRRQLTLISQRWNDRRQELSDWSGTLTRFRGVPSSPNAEFAHTPEISFEIFYEDEWQPGHSVAAVVRETVVKLEKIELPETETVAVEIEDKLEESRSRHDELQAVMETLRQEYNTQGQEHNSVSQRIAALQVDLKRNQDAKKLQDLGSGLGVAAGSQACPTCHQDVARELLPEISTAGMALDENIAFVKSQIDLYRATFVSSAQRLDELKMRYKAFEEELHEKQREIRGLRQALLRPSSSPSRAVVEEIIRHQARLERWQSIQEKADELTDGLQLIAKQWIEFTDRLKRLSGKDLTQNDLSKLEFLEKEIQRHLELYGFRSFQPSEIKLSGDNFRPLVLAADPKEPGRVVEKEIGYEVSASDAIRLKWAYYMAIMAVSGEHTTNHPGMVVFDEPGQQEVEEASLFAFLKWVSENMVGEQQVVVATSEPIDKIRDNLSNKNYTLTSFDGFILQPIN